MKDLSGTTGELPLKGASIHYMPRFLVQDDQLRLFQQLRDELPWRNDPIKVFGKVYPQPRLTCFLGRESGGYTYSGIEMEPTPFPESIGELLDRINREFGLALNCCLANLYRDGRDSNGWHSDDEKELGSRPAIASISLGDERYFHLRPRLDRSDTYKILLEAGSLLLMKPPTQANWQHQIPKTGRLTQARINLTFRRILSQ